MGTCALMRLQNNINYNREYKIHKYNMEMVWLYVFKIYRYVAFNHQKKIPHDKY